jgi:hypothetical protein
MRVTNLKKAIMDIPPNIHIPEKNPFNYELITYCWVFGLSAWGGAVSFMRKMREGQTRPFNIMELIGELVTSAFAGMLTFWLCEAGSINPFIGAAFVGISGHMGSRAISLLEHYFAKKFNVDLPVNDTGKAQ